jgi:hypothetical protein
MFNWKNVTMRYEPFPVFYLRDLLPDEIYCQLAGTFPVLSLFRHRDNLGNKYLLTEAEGQAYFDFIESHPAWQWFYDEVKSIEFRTEVLSFLRSRLNHTLPDEVADGLTSRFEFSALPTNGGSQRPHTDSPRKVVSIVLSLMKDGEWDENWGGGTSICRPKDEALRSNHSNQYLEFAEVEVVDTMPFVPNAGVMFAKTDVSWHCVTPINLSDKTALRKTVAISLYHKDDE